MFVVCGEALWDLFAVEGDAGLSFDARIGGSPFNVAVGLSRLDQRSALFTGLSSDRLGERLLSVLENEGVGTAYLVTKPNPTTLSLVDVGADGAPSYSFYVVGTADSSVTQSDLPELGDVVWGLHAGSYTLVVEPVADAVLSLIRRERGRRLITIDPNVRPTVESNLDLWRNQIDKFLTHADLAKVSEEDLEMLYPAAEPSEIAERWRAAGPAVVIVTRGRAGAEAFGAFGRVVIGGSRVDVVDTVGAGDTFQAALIAGLAERGVKSRKTLSNLAVEDVAALMRFAVQAASLTCSRRGADLPYRSDVNIE